MFSSCNSGRNLTIYSTEVPLGSGLDPENNYFWIRVELSACAGTHYLCRNLLVTGQVQQGAPPKLLEYHLRRLLLVFHFLRMELFHVHSFVHNFGHNFDHNFDHNFVRDV
ncbi:hypothetical protein FWK35_00008268 [Aphis craccivora]|uniref:Uncharacterized protein n=1 Tax=Aphis craccivora TaxID=307492 RepID=A0A6G0Z3R6_APHCR|nr:hypothetical protein FWK35_00008268 [Aphis craccivora]